jgi:chromate transporter
MNSNSNSAREVFFTFLRLGCRSFGGPVAHLGYFHAELVQQRRWCSEQEYAETLALAQSLPGPASSQVAFALGLFRGGWMGSLAAWVGFTMPSALLLFGFAWGHAWFSGGIGDRALHGLQLVAVAVVAQAVLTMQRSLASTWGLRLIALAAAGATLLLPSAFTTIAIIGSAAALGSLLQSASQTVNTPASARTETVSAKAGWIAISAFVILLAVSLLSVALLPAKAAELHILPVFGAFYRTGALVFGGGHVVLPLLERAVVAPGWVDESSFLAGYGATQAVPGPLFTFAAYLGEVIKDPATGAVPGSLLVRAGMSLLALVAIFMPGLLLMVAALPLWGRLRQHPRLLSALRFVNASVVGILFAALIRPVGTTAIHTWFDGVVALAAFAALIKLNAPPWTVVVAVVLYSVAAGAIRP